jgi:hypothetical protein
VQFDGPFIFSGSIAGGVVRLIFKFKVGGIDRGVKIFLLGVFPVRFGGALVALLARPLLTPSIG